MITQMNNQILVFMSDIFTQFSRNSKDTMLARAKDARHFVREARIEGGHAEIAASVMHDAVEAKKRQVYAEIAVWHYRRSARKYRSAAAVLSAALELNLNKRNRAYLDAKVKEYDGRQRTLGRIADKIETGSNGYI